MASSLACCWKCNLLGSVFGDSLVLALKNAISCLLIPSNEMFGVALSVQTFNIADPTLKPSNWLGRSVHLCIAELFKSFFNNR